MASQKSANKFITHTVYCAEVYRAGRVFFQFLAEFEDMVVDSPGGRVVLVAPHFVQQLVTADDAICILHQELERLELLCRQNDRLAIALDFHFLEIHRDVIKADDLSLGRAHRMPQGGANPSQQFPRAERFRNVIVCSQFEEQDLVRDITGSAEDDYWERGGDRFDFLTYVAA